MSDITFSMSADEKDVTRALQNLIKENAKLRGEITKGVEEAKAAAAQERQWAKMREQSAQEAAQQMQRMAAAAQKVKDSIATPFDTAKKAAAELRTMLQAGTLTTEEYRAAYAKLAKDLKEATRDHAAEAAAARRAKEQEAEAARIAAQKEREHTAAVREATAIAEKYATKEERVAAEMKRLNDLRAKGVLSSKDYARAMAAEEQKLKGNEQAATSFGGSLSALTPKLTGMLGVAGMFVATARQLGEEYATLLERQGKARDANLGLAPAQEDALQNLDASLTPQAFLARMRDASRTIGIPERDLTVAASSALSAKGDKTASDAVDAVIASAKLNRFNPDRLPAMAGSALDLGKHLQMAPEEALGFLMGVQRTSRVVNLKGVSENIAPAIIGGVSVGLPKDTAAAVAASISGTSVDPTGATTGTAMHSLFQQMRAFGRPENGFTGGQTLSVPQVLEGLQTNPQMRAAFLGDRSQGGFGATFEQKTKTAIEQLLTPGTQGFNDFQNALAQQRQLNPQQVFNEALKAKEASPALRIATLDQGLANFADQAALMDEGGARSAVIRDRLAEMRKQLGKTSLGTKVTGFFDEIRTGGMQELQTVMQALETERWRITNPQVAGPNFGVVANNMKRGPLSAEEANLERLLTLQIEQLKELIRITGDNRHAGVVAGRRAAQLEGAP